MTYFNLVNDNDINRILRSPKGNVTNIRLMQSIEDKGKPKKRRTDRVMDKLEAIDALGKIIKG